jgi:hypothetical protein
VISAFCCDANETCALVGCYGAQIGVVVSCPYNCVPECCLHSSWTDSPLKMRLIGWPETSVIINVRCLTSKKSEGLKGRFNHERNSNPLRSDRNVHSRAVMYVGEHTWRRDVKANCRCVRETLTEATGLW